MRKWFNISGIETFEWEGARRQKKNKKLDFYDFIIIFLYKYKIYAIIIMQNIVKKNIDFLMSHNSYHTSLEVMQNIVKNLNEKDMVIVSWMKNIGKTYVVNDIINKTWIQKHFFYFNKNLDKENQIIHNKDLKNLLDIYIKNFWEPKIIILQNTNKIENIKEFISYIYHQKNKNNKRKYKTILIWNNIKIENIPEIEVLPKTVWELEKTYSVDIKDILFYGNLKKVYDLHTKEKRNLQDFINMIKNDVFLSDIFYNFSVKNIELYNYTLSFLSKNNTFLSLRELQKNLESHNSISLKTTMDYIDFSLQSKIIRKMYKYDIKWKKTISSKIKYYFTDVGIRNSCYDFWVSLHTLKENLLFNELSQKWYTVYGWMNGKFEFSFIAEKQKEKIYVHLSNQNDKDEIKKEVRKMLKIWWEEKRYLIIEDRKDIWLKKLHYENASILEFEDFIKIIST